MWQLYVFGFLAGSFAANGIPHFIKGSIGQKHQTPFGKDSSAIVNVLWGWVNFVVGTVLLHFAHPRTHEYRALAVFAVGVLVITLFNTYVWTTHPQSDK